VSRVRVGRQEIQEGLPAHLGIYPLMDGRDKALVNGFMEICWIMIGGWYEEFAAR